MFFFSKLDSSFFLNGKVFFAMFFCFFKIFKIIFWRLIYLDIKYGCFRKWWENPPFHTPSADHF